MNELQRRLGVSDEWLAHMEANPDCDCDPSNDSEYGQYECGKRRHEIEPDRYDENGNWIRKPGDRALVQGAFSALTAEIYERYVTSLLNTPPIFRAATDPKGTVTFEIRKDLNDAD